MVFIVTLFFFCFCSQNSQNVWQQKLSVNFSGKPSQIEIGSSYVGLEMHTSSPLLNRISFYYPVANSIDLSTDYWKRDRSRILFLGLKFGNKPIEWLQPDPIDYVLTPYSVMFKKSDDEKIIQIGYEFCKNKPAFVTEIKVTNKLANPIDIELFTHLETSLRTSHSYKLKDKSRTEFDAIGSTIYFNFDDPETGSAQIFVTNVGEPPQNDSTQRIIQSSQYTMNQLPDDPFQPAAEFVYSKKVAPKSSLQVAQIIGSARQDEGREIVRYLRDHYKREISAYQNDVLKKAYQDIIQTNDTVLDHSVRWAQAILATNIHYLDGEFLPMPCPTEYNFFFTHDVQLTDLAAVNFDLARVKNDLEFIIKHATDDKIIPHAYYWRDDRYVTEYATPDNWNHFWLILLCASYLRHASDIPMLEKLYPFIEASLSQALQHQKDDGLIWADRPDWWDIGRSYGPRAYMTILMIRAIRDYIFLSTVLNKNLDQLVSLENRAQSMQNKLTGKLWDDDLKYLINYFKDSRKDAHIYIGSLLAAHFQLLDPQKANTLLETAKDKLLDEKIGIYNVYPMDFHLLIDDLKFAGNEAGDPHIYANGGIWPHGNAWYALGLIAIDKKTEAFQFIRKVMTLDGIMNSPNGQPAMYEYRNSNANNPSIYGRIDKPQFMWAGGWYLYTLYHLLGLRENEWNIRFDPYMIAGQQWVQFNSFINGHNILITIKGQGDQVGMIKVDGKSYPSLVLPAQFVRVDQIELTLGTPVAPYLLCTNSILKNCQYNSNNKKLILELKGFIGHRNETIVLSPWEPGSIKLKAGKVIPEWDREAKNGSYWIHIHFTQPESEDVIEIQFDEQADNK